MQKEKLFVYGTLRYKRFRKTAFGRVVPGERALLRDHKKLAIPVNGEPYSALIPERGHRVHGLLLTVTPHELERCDAYEERYQRRRVTLAGNVSAWTYAMKMY